MKTSLKSHIESLPLLLDENLFLLLRRQVHNCDVHVVNRRIDDLQGDESALAGLQRIRSDEANLRHVEAREQLDAILDGARIVLRLDDVVLAVATTQGPLDRQILVLRIQMFHRFGLVGGLRQALFDCCD